MSKTAKIFNNGRSEAVRLPAEYRFNTKEVFIHRDHKTGNVILSARPQNWDSFLNLLKTTKVDDTFLSPKERNQDLISKDPFEDNEE